MTIFSGYFNQYHKNVYGQPAYGAQDVNSMMVPLRPQQQPQQQQQQQSSQQGADPMTALNMYEQFAGEGAVGGETAAGTEVAAAPAAETGTAASGEGAGYGAMGWWAALAAAVGKGADYNQDKGYHTWSDIEQGKSGVEKWKNAGWEDQADEFSSGLGEIGGGSARIASWNPKEKAKGAEDVAKGTGEFSRNFVSGLNDASKDIARQNFEGAKQFSNTTLVKPFEKSVEFTKKTLNPFKWFD